MFIRKIIKINDDNLEEHKNNICVSRYKKFNFILFDEDIYIDFLTIPKGNKRNLDSIVKNYIMYLFKDIENICYSYSICSKKQRELIIQIQCINSRKTDILRVLNKTCTITSIGLIQLYYFNYIRKLLKLREFILVFQSGKSIYNIGGDLENRISSFVMEKSKVNYNELYFALQKVYCSLGNGREDYKIKIYFLNFEDTTFIKKTALEYEVIDLGNIQEELIIKKSLGG